MIGTKKVVMNTDVVVPIGNGRSKTHYSAGLRYDVPPEVADEWLVGLLARLPGESPPCDNEHGLSGRALRLERLKQESLEQVKKEQEQHDAKKAAIKHSKDSRQIVSDAY